MKSILTIASIVSVIAFAGCNGQQMTSGEVELNNQIDSVSYSLGLNIAQNIKSQGMEEVNVEAIAKAFRDVFNDEPTQVDASQAGMILNTYFQNLQANQAAANQEANEAFLEENGQRAEVTELPSGLQYEVLEEGSGPVPGEDNRVKVHYHGTNIDGTVFDSSVERGEPVEFGVTEVIPGWTEALQMMPVGSKWKIYVPSGLAYGERGAGQQIQPYATLIFEIELIEIVE